MALLLAGLSISVANNLLGFLHKQYSIDTEENEKQQQQKQTK